MSLKKAYLYLVSIISLIIVVTGAIMLINMGLKTWVFTKADQGYYRQPCFSGKNNPDGTSMKCTTEEQAEQEKIDRENRTAEKQREAAQAIAMLIVAGPVWFFHWRLARKEV